MINLQSSQLTPALTLDRVTTGYGGPPVLIDITLAVPRGQSVGIIGPNGGGKSTLFRVMLGLLQPEAGRVEIFGGAPTRAHRQRRRVGYVPQGRNATDFPISVEQMVMTGRLGHIGLLRWPGRADRAAVEAALVRVGLIDHRRQRLGALSGGQRQRAFLARALAQDSEILILDEPLTGLDLPSQEAIHSVLVDCRACGVTVLIATHDLECLNLLGLERLIALNRSIIADGPPAGVMNEALLTATYGSIVSSIRRLLVGPVEDRQ